MKKFFLLAFLVCWLADGFSQSAKPLVSGGTGILYNTEKATHFGLTTGRGWRVGWQRGELKTWYRTHFFQINLSEIRHEKEHRQASDPSLGRSFRSYVFGKQNNFFAVRGGWGRTRYFSEKARQKGVALGMSWMAGPTLGILKPYYLALRREGEPGVSRQVLEKYSDENAHLFLDNTKIVGAAPFFKGFTEPKFMPGGHASVALHIDWGAFDEYVKALEVGLQLDLFPKKVPILVSEENRSFFLNFFVIMQFGKRR